MVEQKFEKHTKMIRLKTKVKTPFCMRLRERNKKANMSAGKENKRTSFKVKLMANSVFCVVSGSSGPKKKAKATIKRTWTGNENNFFNMVECSFILVPVFLYIRRERFKNLTAQTFLEVGDFIGPFHVDAAEIHIQNPVFF